MPVIAAAIGEPYYVTLFTRIVIFALAAVGPQPDPGLRRAGELRPRDVHRHRRVRGRHPRRTTASATAGCSSRVALAVGAVVAVVIGLICLRTSGMAFIMITLAFAQMLYFLAISLKQYGGDDGLTISARSDFGLFSLREQRRALLLRVRRAGRAASIAFRRLVHSRFGMVLRGCRSNERRMAALGFPTLRYKLTAYVISALVCVVAGVLLANLTKFAAPSYMAWQASGDLIVMIVLGGMGTVVGPVAGAVALLDLRGDPRRLDDALDDRARPGDRADRAHRQEGPVRLSWSSATRARAERGRSGAMTLLEVSGLVKRFGGLTATDGVDLTVEPGEVHAVIGPNGAGKTTLINQLAGELAPDAGSIRFDGRDITHEPVYRRALLGLGRSYQITSVFPEFSVLTNVMLAVQAHAGHSFSLLAAARRRGRARRARARRARRRWAWRPKPTCRSQRSRTASAASSKWR